MIKINDEKYYTTQEAAAIVGLTPRAIQYHAAKKPEILQDMDGRKYIKASDLKQIIGDKKK